MVLGTKPQGIGSVANLFSWMTTIGCGGQHDRLGFITYGNEPSQKPTAELPSFAQRAMISRPASRKTPGVSPFNRLKPEGVALSPIQAGGREGSIIRRRCAGRTNIRGMNEAETQLL